jgi:hypothetical protein
MMVLFQEQRKTKPSGKYGAVLVECDRSGVGYLVTLFQYFCHSVIFIPIVIRYGSIQMWLENN